MAGWSETSEPWVHEPPPEPRAPSFVVREIPTCPECHGLCRRNLNEHGEGKHGPYRCDRHGEVAPVWAAYEVPTGYEEDE